MDKKDKVLGIVFVSLIDGKNFFAKLVYSDENVCIFNKCYTLAFLKQSPDFTMKLEETSPVFVKVFPVKDDADVIIDKSNIISILFFDDFDDEIKPLVLKFYSNIVMPSKDDLQKSNIVNLEDFKKKNH